MMIIVPLIHLLYQGTGSLALPEARNANMQVTTKLTHLLL
jgi:hypothetical protein